MPVHEIMGRTHLLTSTSRSTQSWRTSAAPRDPLVLRRNGNPTPFGLPLYGCRGWIRMRRARDGPVRLPYSRAWRERDDALAGPFGPVQSGREGSFLVGICWGRAARG